MTKYVKLFLAVISLITLFNFGAGSAYATSPFYSDVCGGLQQVSSTGCNNGNNTVKEIATTAVGILSIVIGVVSVIVLIFAGFRFVTAGGDANSISSARNMIVYAIVGIVVAVLAQVIVHDVTNTASHIQDHSFLNGQTIDINVS